MKREDVENSDKRGVYIGYLEELARSNLLGPVLPASLEKLQRDATLEGDTIRILKLCEEHLKRLLDFQVTSFFLAGDQDSEFELVKVDPESEKLEIEKEIDEQMENGNFAWAVNQNRPVVVKSKKFKKSLVLHALATKSRVQGMFAGVLTREDEDVHESALYPLSIILQNTSYLIERAALRKSISGENKNLEQIVQKRTQSLEDQIHELKQEIAYRRLAGESLVAAKEEAERAACVKNDFIANISHEFRTPLNAILGYCEILRSETMKFNRPDILEDLRSMETSGRHLLKLFNDILDYSKIQAGKMDVNLEDFKVLGLVGDVMDAIRPLARKNRNTISVASQEIVDVMFSDSGKVRQLLLNLLGNACKFTEDGSVSLKVTRETRNQIEWLVFSVSDTGIGISSEMIPELFKEFSQAESVARRYGGAGLGLSISRGLCRMLGGEITVTSELGKGTVFTARLPVNAAETESGCASERKKVPPAGKTGESPAAEELEVHEFPPPPKPGDAASAEEKRKIFLAIADDQSILDPMRRFMEMEGFTVHTALNAAEGLRLARKIPPDIITLDATVSENDGWSVLSELKEDPCLSHIPVVMITAAGERDRAAAAGAADLLTKPVEWDRLRAIIKGLREPAPASLKVLVVEDDAVNRSALCRILRREGMQALEAEDGVQAMNLMETETPGLILLDLVLPECNGFDFLKIISQNGRWRRIPIIVVSARELSREDLKKLKTEVDCIFQKGNYSRGELLREIQTLAEKSTKQRCESSHFFS